MHKFKQLTVWNDAVNLAVEVYSMTNSFPSEEKFGLISQLRRATVSIASNIAEGSCRNTDGEFVHFLGIASGSVAEMETQFIIANKLGFIEAETLNDFSIKCETISNKLWKLKSSLKK